MGCRRSDRGNGNEGGEEKRGGEKRSVHRGQENSRINLYVCVFLVERVGQIVVPRAATIAPLEPSPSHLSRRRGPGGRRFGGRVQQRFAARRRTCRRHRHGRERGVRVRVKVGFDCVRVATHYMYECECEYDVSEKRAHRRNRLILMLMVMVMASFFDRCLVFVY